MLQFSRYVTKGVSTMSKGQRIIVGLLTATVALLVLNLMPEPAQAQVNPHTVTPNAVALGIVGDPGVNAGFVFRLWSDGVLETKRYSVNFCGEDRWCAWEIVPD